MVEKAGIETRPEQLRDATSSGKHNQTFRSSVRQWTNQHIHLTVVNSFLTVAFTLPLSAAQITVQQPCGQCKPNKYALRSKVELASCYPRLLVRSRFLASSALDRTSRALTGLLGIWTSNSTSSHSHPHSEAVGVGQIL